MLVDGGKTVGVWVLLVIIIMGWGGLGMEVVDGEHQGYSNEGLAT